MNKVKIIISICILVGIIDCNAQNEQPERISYGHPYDLTQLDFEMNVPRFMSGSKIYKDYITEDEDYQKIEASLQQDYDAEEDPQMCHFCHWVQKTITPRDYIQNIPRTYSNEAIIYNQAGWMPRKTLATFHTLNFARMCTIMDLNSKLMGMEVQQEKNDSTDIEATIRYCDSIYTRIDSKDMKSGKKYRWEDQGLVYAMTIEKKKIILNALW